MSIETLALNPGSGVLHKWNCTMGPFRGNAGRPNGRSIYAHLYTPVPAVVLPSIKPECRCTFCLDGPKL
jgi:hypothetical protein